MKNDFNLNSYKISLVQNFNSIFKSLFTEFTT